MSKAIHFKGLNGIRAIAAVGVMLAHILGDLGQFGLKKLPSSLNIASLGVTMFFTLSGFLITYLLLKEKAANEKNQINISNFYIRRILRIWPLYFLYVFLSLLTYWYFSIDFDAKMLFFYFFLLANVPLIIEQTLPFIGHLWSVAVEEQFYLFWPWFSKIDTKKLLFYTLLLTLSLILLKDVSYILSSKFALKLPLITLTTTRFYCMLIGCIAAILFVQKSVWIARLTNKYVAIGAWLILFLAIINKFQISSALIDHEILSIVTVIVILTQINEKNKIVNLDNRVLDFFGKISYGIYVYHPILIFLSIQFLGKFQKDIFINYLFVFSLIFSLTIFLSYFSFHFFENKFIKMKDKFSSIKSSM
jgi:peptidoglycan/LPS O-acetylase OafA/YrhL